MPGRNSSVSSPMRTVPEVGISRRLMQRSSVLFPPPEGPTSAGYPEDSTLFYPVLLYLQAFSYFNMGYASAMTMLLLVVALTVTVLILRSSRLWVFYAGARR